MQERVCKNHSHMVCMGPSNYAYLNGKCLNMGQGDSGDQCGSSPSCHIVHNFFSQFKDRAQLVLNMQVTACMSKRSVQTLIS